MANYYSSARTNYFRVKDTGAFMSWVKEFEVNYGVEVASKKDSFALLFDTDCGIPPFRDQIDFIDELATHLADNEVAVFLECGAEKLRYIFGCAVAVNNKLERRTINFDSIYEMAKDLGSNITEAQY